jgi:hypothetical protein
MVSGRRLGRAFHPDEVVRGHDASAHPGIGERRRLWWPSPGGHTEYVPATWVLEFADFVVGLLDCHCV